MRFFIKKKKKFILAQDSAGCLGGGVHPRTEPASGEELVLPLPVVNTD